MYLTRSVSLALLMVVAGSTGVACQSDTAPPLLLVNLTQSDESVMERTGSVTLTAEWSGVPTSHSWKQISGPHVEIVDGGINGATLVMDKVEVAARLQGGVRVRRRRARPRVDRAGVGRGPAWSTACPPSETT